MKATSPETELIGALNDLLRSLVRAVVTKPDSVAINQSVHGSLVAFIIKTSGEDIPRVIGSKGKHFRALEAIIANLAKLINRESHITIDESTPRTVSSSSKSPNFSAQKDLAPVEVLLKKTISMFMDSPDAAKVIRTDLGTTTIFEIRANERNCDSITGNPTTFDYGTDGMIIGSIKNLFDGIGKNHGRLIRVVLTEV